MRKRRRICSSQPLCLGQDCILITVGRSCATNLQEQLQHLAGFHHCTCTSQPQLGRAHLLVGIHEQQSVFELFFLENCVKLFPRGPYSLSVTAIYHIDDSLRVRVVTSPVRTYACLTSQVPHLELDVFVCDRLHVKPNSCKVSSAGLTLMKNCAEV